MSKAIGLSLRLFVEAADMPAALGQAGVLTRGLEPTLATSDVTIRQYWKRPEWYELSLTFEHPDYAETFHELKGALADSWIDGGASDDPDAIWVAGEGKHFMLPSARWAHLQYAFDPIPD